MESRDNLSLLLYFFSLTFLNNFILLFKKRLYIILFFFNIFFNIVFFFQKFKFSWFLYFIHFFRISGFYNIFFKNSILIANNYLLDFSLFIRYNINSIIYLTLDLNNNLFLNFNYFIWTPMFRLFLNKLYIISFIKNILLFRQFKLCFLNTFGVFYSGIHHTFKYSKEVINFNDTFPQVIGSEDNSRRGFFKYTKLLKSINLTDGYVGGLYIRYSFDKFNWYKNSVLNFFNLFNVSRLHFLDMFYFFVNNNYNYSYFQLFKANGTLNYNYFLSSSHYLVNNTGRKFLTYISLLFNRRNTSPEWKLAFFEGNVLSNVRYVYPYLFDYWLVKYIPYSNYGDWLFSINNFIMSSSLQYQFTDINSNNYFLANSIRHLNSLPFYMLDRSFKRVISEKFSSRLIEGTYWLLHKYVGKFLENLLCKKIFLVMYRNPSSMISSSLYSSFKRGVKNKNLFFQRIYFSSELVDILIWLSITKDPKPFVIWLAKNLSETMFEKHWAFISYIRKSLDSCWGYMNYISQFRGIRIRFKGKIGNRGSFRKKTSVIYKGFIAKSDVYARADTAFKPSFNFTGVIGIFVTISYY